MPRPPNPTVRARILADGIKVVQAHGFNGCGVQDIASAAGIPKGSFYNYFATKEAFAVEILEEYWSVYEIAYAPILSDPALEPLDRVAAFFRSLSREHERDGYALGCLLGSLALELSASSLEVRAKLIHLLDRWARPLSRCLAEAQADGVLAPDVDLDELAAVLIEAWEGAALRGKILRSALPYARFEAFLLRHLLVQPPTTKTKSRRQP
jgi:TetR/AcrR family transcriptional repressor of nem operon